MFTQITMQRFGRPQITGKLLWLPNFWPQGLMFTQITMQRFGRPHDTDMLLWLPNFWPQGLMFTRTVMKIFDFGLNHSGRGGRVPAACGSKDRAQRMKRVIYGYAYIVLRDSF
jgi:hypothetical protein